MTTWKRVFAFCQKARKRYEKTKSEVAIRMTYEEMNDMLEMISPPLESPVKAVATFPMIRETEGRMAPAIIADSMPMESRILSYAVMNVKNFVMLTAAGASSIWLLVIYSTKFASLDTIMEVLLLLFLDVSSTSRELCTSCR